MNRLVTILRHPAPPSRGIWPRNAVAWFLVLFYVLASVRAFIPGLCATQEAMNNQCAVDTGGAILTGSRTHCCQSPAPAAPKDGKKRPITPAESHCAFCNLIIGLTDPPERLILPPPATPKFARRIPLQVQVVQEVSRGHAPNRAPPA